MRPHTLIIVIIFTFTFLVPIPSFGAEYKHMVSFGSSGLNWSGSAERISTEKNSPFERVDFFFHHVQFNYAYRFTSNMQIGGFYQTWHQEYTFHTKDGKSSSSDLENSLFGLFLLYNFSERIPESYFVGLSSSIFNSEEENSGDLKNVESKDPFEIDDSGFTYEVIFGKRFSLMKWNIDHFTFAPQLSLFHRTHGKDFNDQKIADGVGFIIQAIKFDFLF